MLPGLFDVTATSEQLREQRMEFWSPDRLSLLAVCSKMGLRWSSIKGEHSDNDILEGE